jgi:hypothetical protein
MRYLAVKDWHNMKTEETIDSQCPSCLSLKLLTEKGVRTKKTFVVFNKIKKEMCYGCK